MSVYLAVGFIYFCYHIIIGTFDGFIIPSEFRELKRNFIDGFDGKRRKLVFYVVYVSIMFSIYLFTVFMWPVFMICRYAQKTRD